MNGLKTLFSSLALSPLIFSIGCHVSVGNGTGTQSTTYSIGGQIQGLTDTLTITNNGGDPLLVNANGNYAFNNELIDGDAYLIEISNQPTGQTCTVSNGSGNINSSDVGNVDIDCVTVWLGTQQFGTNWADIVNGGTIGPDNSLYTVGYRWEPSLITQAGTLWKRDASGGAVWETLVDTTDTTHLWDVAIDALGNAYVVGQTLGNTGSQTNQGKEDVIVAKINLSGVVQWKKLIGGNDSDFGYGIALGANNMLYISGFTNSADFEGQSNIGNSDAFVTKLSTTDGAFVWAVLLGDDGQLERNTGGIAVTAQDDIIVTYADFNAGPGFDDIAVIKLDNLGNPVWAAPQIYGGTNTDTLDWGRIDIDSNGNIYIAGQTYSGSFYGESNSGNTDVFVMKLDSSGVKQWSHLLGTSGYDSSRAGVSVDSQGDVIIAGRTEGVLPGQNTAGGYDIFAAKWDTDGTPQWIKQAGSDSVDTEWAVMINSDDDVIVAGYTLGDLDGNTSLGNEDAYLMKFDGTTGDVVPATP